MTLKRIASFFLAVGLAPISGWPAGVLVGLDRIAASDGKPLKGRKVGLVANAASVTSDGKLALDVLRDNGVEVVRLFAPEHGLAATAPAGEPVRDRSAGADLPVVSLYGSKTKPDPEDLAGLDALVFDLQDAGVRFYTYASTMLLCLDAAAQASIEFVVLDRPNPLGGERIEGPVVASDQVQPSLLNLAPGPLVHGLTLGEMARYVNERAAKKAKLRVIEMSGWKRSMVWADTGRTWVPPSPNLPSAETTVAYPGLALLEATNMSEGRGTEAPFLLVGAPGLRPTALAGIGVPGFVLEPARFMPHAVPWAPAPKHADRDCVGVRIRVQDAHAAQPYALGLSILFELRWQPGFQFLRAGAAFDELLGTRAVRTALQRGDKVESILKLDARAQSAWSVERQKALLYK